MRVCGFVLEDPLGHRERLRAAGVDDPRQLTGRGRRVVPVPVDQVQRADACACQLERDGSAERADADDGHVGVGQPIGCVVGEPRSQVGTADGVAALDRDPQPVAGGGGFVDRLGSCFRPQVGDGEQR